MKKCTRCGNSFEKDIFPIANKSTGKICSMCKECKRKYDREYYKSRTNKNRKQKLQTQRIKENRGKFIEVLKKSKCADCGEKNILVLEFDHIHDKKRNVGNMVNGGCSWENIEKEMSKCAVRCANCHRIKTAKEQGWSKYLGAI